jgi:hypothetical protein
MLNIALECSVQGAEVDSELCNKIHSEVAILNTELKPIPLLLQISGLFFQSYHLSTSSGSPKGKTSK